jgi:hypothetical protein
MKKAIECTGRVLPNGNLDIPAAVKVELQLRPNSQVRVIVVQPEETEEEKARKEAELAQQRHAAVAALLELRKEFAGMNFSLTDELVRMRELENE